MTSEFEETGIRFTDKRRVDPQTNQVRQPVTPADEPDLAASIDEAIEGALLEADVAETVGKIDVE